MQDECMVEDLKSEIDMILNMLFNIYAKSDEWYEPQLIRVFYNPMGAYQFKELKEEK